MGDLPRLSILVVDRDEGSNVDTKEFLTDAGHRVEVSTDPDAILEALAERRYEVILLDIVSAGAADVDWAEKIRAADPDVCIVAMTGLPAPSASGVWPGGQVFDHYVQKPIDRDELEEALAAVVGDRGPAGGRPLGPVAPAPAPRVWRRPVSGLSTKQLLYGAIDGLPRGRGLVERWVRRLPGFDLPRTRIEVDTVFGTRMRVNPSDNSLERSVFVRGIYEVPGTAFLLSVLPRLGVFWDVGAHVGYHTLLGSRMMGPRGRVVAFEPHPRVRALLEENVRCFGGDNVSVVDVGLSDEDGEQEIFDEGEDATRAPTFVAGIYGRSGHICRLRRGDGLMDPTAAGNEALPRPDLIKIDIEGYEDRALRGMARLIAGAAPPILLFEINRVFNPDHTRVLDFLASHGGYEFHVERRERRFPPRRGPSDGPFPGFAPLCGERVPEQCNVLAVRPDRHGWLLRAAGTGPAAVAPAHRAR